MALRFAVNWDYRCPFARNAHEHVLAGLDAGADWQVDFVPFSLSQVHVAEGEPDVWDNPAKARDLIALQAGIVVRDQQPDLFRTVHGALFRARHDNGRDLRDRDVVAEVIAEAGADAAPVLAAIDDGWPAEALRKAHESSVAEQSVWGVPTFIVGDRAAFVRLMTRPESDGRPSVGLIERVVEAVGGWTEVNELKHTTLGR
ncbi:MAG TPA: DsbA family protein [Acidimicrobiales bacterium]|nr:DsbA family protein [Acidimicrobiales bacterium]